jgi:hypothetical protein
VDPSNGIASIVQDDEIVLCIMPTHVLFPRSEGQDHGGIVSSQPASRYASTAARASELFGMTWGEVVLTAKLWTIPGDPILAHRVRVLFRTSCGV